MLGVFGGWLLVLRLLAVFRGRLLIFGLLAVFRWSLLVLRRLAEFRGCLLVLGLFLLVVRFDRVLAVPGVVVAFAVLAGLPGVLTAAVAVRVLAIGRIVGRRLIVVAVLAALDGVLARAVARPAVLTTGGIVGNTEIGAGISGGGTDLLARTLRPARHPGVPRRTTGPLPRGRARRGDAHAESFHLGTQSAGERAQDRLAQITLDRLLCQRRRNRQQRETLRDGERLHQLQPGLLCATHRGDGAVGRAGGEFGNHLRPHCGQHVLLVVHTASSPDRFVGAHGLRARRKAPVNRCIPVILRTTEAGSNAVVR
ncbi:hypothetical protein ASD42_26035 [Nocardia sp. Root136]|nr:hypothetical protein ASD42_26035 [Nocardia sp. Root136]